MAALVASLLKANTDTLPQITPNLKGPLRSLHAQQASSPSRIKARTTHLVVQQILISILILPRLLLVHMARDMLRLHHQTTHSQNIAIIEHPTRSSHQTADMAVTHLTLKVQVATALHHPHDTHLNRSLMVTTVALHPMAHTAHLPRVLTIINTRLSTNSHSLADSNPPLVFHHPALKNHPSAIPCDTANKPTNSEGP